MMGSSIFQILSIAFFATYLLGIINVYFTDKNDYCDMTFMYEYPQFVRISLPENAVYPQYGLYAYSEGRLTERARKMWFNGVPVLFLPGNSGSYKQVRSLASVALRKAMDKTKHEFHFDYFTISYNEELSGLYGGVLQSQTKFAAACISKILSLYKSNRYTKNIPTSVILIGHSMGGLIAKRLLAYPSTLNTTNIVITLAAPLQGPIINTDLEMDDYYKLINYEWNTYVNENAAVKEKKVVLSFGNGPRDVLMPSGLTTSNDSYIGALTTSIPGVWVSPDHVGIAWCKQIVMAINKYLFSIVNPLTDQLHEDSQKWKSKARFYFQANRTMILDPNNPRPEVAMLADAFWYEDSRRIYQISRPEISKMTYLMIRLVTYPQNRFVAIEANNVVDSNWIFGCNAMHTYETHRYCKQATSLSELSRWTGAAKGHGKRRLATINLHKLKDTYPDWTHVIVRVSPTRKPVVLNVDINDYASRVIIKDLPSELSFGKQVILERTEPNSLYYELYLPEFNKVYQTYLLYVEPTSDCKVSQYHVSAELHVPWAKNHNYFHYFTPLKRSPMKLRLFATNPNMTTMQEPENQPRVVLLLDPQCTYTISISSSWYNRLAQLARNYSPVLIPYVGAILLLAIRWNFKHFKERGTLLSIHGALMGEGVKPYYALVFARMASVVFMSVPMFSFLLENASWNNLELQFFTRSLLVLPAYMVALGFVNVIAAATIVVMVFSSQLAHRLLFRIVWRGGSSFAERVASGLQKVPLVVSAAMICAVPLSCGAASLAVGAAFYAFMLSKMYEEYLEDYVYKLMAKFASRLCYVLKGKKGATNTNNEETSLVPKDNAAESTAESTLENSEKSLSVVDKKEVVGKFDNKKKSKKNKGTSDNNKVVNVKSANTDKTNNDKEDDEKPKGCDDIGNKKGSNEASGVDDELNNLHFHLMMFLLWMCVTLANVPALLTWAKNFKHSAVLKPDTSYQAGLLMSFCSGCVWQMDGPRHKLKQYENLLSLLFAMSVIILALGPLSLTIVNYGMTGMFAAITIQQLCDTEERTGNEVNNPDEDNNDEAQDDTEYETQSEEEVQGEPEPAESTKEKAKTNEEKEKTNECDECNENRIYTLFKNVRDKFSLVGEET